MVGIWRFDLRKLGSEKKARERKKEMRLAFIGDLFHVTRFRVGRNKAQSYSRRGNSGFKEQQRERREGRKEKEAGLADKDSIGYLCMENRR